jgi:hypothetical protein
VSEEIKKKDKIAMDAKIDSAAETKKLKIISDDDLCRIFSCP